MCSKPFQRQKGLIEIHLGPLRLRYLFSAWVFGASSASTSIFPARLVSLHSANLSHLETHWKMLTVLRCVKRLLIFSEPSGIWCSRQCVGSFFEHGLAWRFFPSWPGPEEPDATVACDYCVTTVLGESEAFRCQDASSWWLSRWQATDFIWFYHLGLGWHVIYCFKIIEDVWLKHASMVKKVS